MRIYDPKVSCLDAEKTRAAFYGLYLRRVEGLDADEAAALVAERYPRVRPFLARLLRHARPGLNETERTVHEHHTKPGV